MDFSATFKVHIAAIEHGSIGIMGNLINQIPIHERVHVEICPPTIIRICEIFRIKHGIGCGHIIIGVVVIIIILHHLRFFNTDRTEHMIDVEVTGIFLVRRTAVNLKQESVVTDSYTVIRDLQFLAYLISTIISSVQYQVDEMRTGSIIQITDLAQIKSCVITKGTLVSIVSDQHP